MDRRITIEKMSTSLDDSNQPVKSWATFDEVWAEYLPKRGREYFTSGQIVSEANVVWRIRHRGDLNRTMRIKYDGATYDIVSINELGRREGLEIITKANVE